MTTFTRAQAQAMLVALDREQVIREGFAAFVKLAWPIVEPTIPLQWNWHLDEFCVHAEALCPPWREADGSWARPLIYDLVVNVPPGTTKTKIWAVLWNAYVWTFRPEYRMIWASYHPTVALMSAEQTFKLVSSKWYTDRWGKILRSGPQAMGDFETLAGGFRFSTSVGGPLTGKHAHFLGADDPIKPAGVDSASSEISAAVLFANNWWTNTAGSRALDKTNFVRAIIMQRIHESDPSQQMIDGGATHVCIPALFEVERRFKTPFGVDPRTVEGEPIMIEGRLSKAAFDAEARRLGGWDGPVASAQLQQRPAPKGGLMFRDDTFGHFVTLAYPLNRCGSFISVDANFKKSDDAADIGIVRLGSQLPKMRVYAAYSERGGLIRAIELIKQELREGGPARGLLIEAKANGDAIIELLNHPRHGLRGVPIVALIPLESKEARAHAANVYYQAHGIEHADDMRGMGKTAFEGLLSTFPRGKKKDVVDALTQAILYAAKFDQTAWNSAMAAYSAQDRAILGGMGGGDDGGIDFDDLFSIG